MQSFFSMDEYMNLVSREVKLPDGTILPSPVAIACVGAGGKTSVMFWLAQQFKAMALRVFCTTTTHINQPTPSQCDTFILNDNAIVRLDLLKKHATAGQIICCASTCEPSLNKVKGLAPQEINTIKALGLFDVCLVEADGAQGLTIKAPAIHEPVIPSNTDVVMALVSAQSLLRPANPALIHRWESFAAITQCQEGVIIDETILCRLINHPNGMFKNAPKQAIRILVINALDLALSESSLIALSQKLLNKNPQLQAIWLIQTQHKTQVLRHLITNNSLAGLTENELISTNECDPYL